MALHFLSGDLRYNLKNKNTFRKWINSEILSHGYKQGQINIIFCSDEYLLEINKKYLNHNYYTDIITFNYNTGKNIAGDLFISIDRIRENAENFHSGFVEEMRRVIIHGVLHLLGFSDHLPDLKSEIHRMEDEALSRFPGQASN